MDDLINRQAVIDKAIMIPVARIVTEDKVIWRKVVFVEDIEALPSVDAVPVVRCGDCKHWIPYDWMFSEVRRSQRMSDYPDNEIGCEYADMSMSASDFCSRGERREESDDT